MRIHRCAWIVALASMLVPRGAVASEAAVSSRLHVDYIEASTANRWDLPGLPARQDLTGVDIHLHAVYDFDKSSAIAQVLSESVEGPRVVILQECAVYFPGDLPTYHSRVALWVDQLESSGLRAALATTVPPAADRGAMHGFKEFVKVRVLGRPGQAAQVWAFNDWLREYARHRSLPLLDLEEVLRTSDRDRHLDPRLDSGDGIHVNAEAYGILDDAFAKFLNTALRPPQMID